MAGAAILLLAMMQGAAPAPSAVEAYRSCGATLAADHAAEMPDAPPDLVARASTARCEHLLPAAVADLPEADTPEKKELVMEDYRQRSIIDLTQRVATARIEKK